MLNALASAGSDLAKPHTINHYLYFPEKGDAKRAGKSLITEGYAVDVRRAAKGSDWLVLARHSIIPSVNTIARVTAHMEWVATSMRGEYDGWEAAIVEQDG